MTSEAEVILGWAENMLAEMRANYSPDPRLAAPFGLPYMEEWRWRVSPDVRAALVVRAAAMGVPPSLPILHERLCGITLTVDAKLPPHSIVLVPPEALADEGGPAAKTDDAVEFRLKADVTFMASSIEDALLRLAEHFGRVEAGEDSDLVQSGNILVGRLGDERFDRHRHDSTRGRAADR